jgi:CubicO group peptidase (beta-lactamase class C family)
MTNTFSSFRLNQPLILCLTTVLLAFGHSSFVIGQTAIKSKQLSGIDKSMSRAVESMNLPSLSVAIVHDGELIWSQSYGTLDVNSEASATPEALYAVASNTKAFTSAALAQLVDAGKIDWDDRVTDYLPSFKLYDAYVTSDLRIRDLLCHRSGLATFSGDLLWYGTTWTAEEVLEKAQHLQPTSSFRTEFGYQNILYIAAGKIIETVTGQPWKKCIQDSLLTRVGMGQSALSILDLDPTQTIAQPHNETSEGNLVPIEWVNWDNMAPAGALLASVADMAKWMVVQLDSGRIADKRLWNQAQTQQMWSMHTPIPVSNWYRSKMPSMHFRGYGLGWEMATLHGRKIVGHSGGYDGMISRQMLVPEEKIGVFIVTNTNSSVPWALGYDFLDVLLDGNYDFDMLTFLESNRVEENANRTKELEIMEATRVQDTKPSHPLSDFVGSYTDSMYGSIEITAAKDGLGLQFIQTPLFKAELKHWHYDTFQLNWSEQMMLPSGMVHFTIDAMGKVEALDVNVPNPDFDFTELHFVRD